ncbi:MAG: hypothetical protein K8963_07045 [Proteobacteria bacterium]|nr:hypothetical protein [Pseudomonadota bacterium]
MPSPHPSPSLGLTQDELFSLLLGYLFSALDLPFRYGADLANSIFTVSSGLSLYNSRVGEDLFRSGWLDGTVSAGLGVAFRFPYLY